MSTTDDEKYCPCGNVLNEDGACPRCELEPYEARGPRPEMDELVERARRAGAV